MKKFFWLPLLVAVVFCGCNESVDYKSGTSTTKSAQLNGKLDTAEAHRAVVAFRTKGEPESTFCTGTLIAPNYVLTAAHCFGETARRYTTTKNPENPRCDYQAVAALTGFQSGWRNSVASFGNNDDETSNPDVQFAIDTVSIPNDYADIVISTCDNRGRAVEESMIINDIALVKLKQSVPESVAKPIPVLPPWLGANDELYTNDMNTEFVGFGYNEKGEIGYKLTFTRPINGICKSVTDEAGKEMTPVCHYNETITINACHPSSSYCDYYGRTRETYDTLPYYPGTMFYRQDDGGPCQGDSGGPAFVKIGGKEYLAGITSYGDSACAGYGISTDTQSLFNKIGLNNIPEIMNQFVEVCGNGIDDDGNGLTDEDDVECSPCPATFTFYNQWTNKASGGENDFDVYLVGSFNTTEDGTWILDDERYKMTSDGNGTHSITFEYPKNASFNYKYHVKGWVNSENGEDNGWFTDAANDGDAVANFSVCGKRYGVVPAEGYCGDGIRQDDEFCDNNDFPEDMATCSAVNATYVSGRLKCTADCKFDLSNCSEEEEGGIGNGESNNTRTSIPTDPKATEGSITIADLIQKPAHTGLPSDEDTDDQTPVAPEDPQSTEDDDSNESCSASPLNPSRSIPGALAILFGLSALIGLRRRKEN